MIAIKPPEIYMICLKDARAVRIEPTIAVAGDNPLIGQEFRV